jgi:hypothetical protein
MKIPHKQQHADATANLQVDQARHLVPGVDALNFGFQGHAVLLALLFACLLEIQLVHLHELFVHTDGYAVVVVVMVEVVVVVSWWWSWWSCS